MDLGIAGRIALVTGGSRGLGKHCALSLAREGVNVAICGRSRDTLDATAAELQALGVEAVGIVADVSDTDQAAPLHGQVVDQLGPVDILVNNVGGSLVRTDAPDITVDELRGVFDLNVFGGYALMRLVIPHMREQKWGRIINIASIYGREFGGNLGYMTAKAALIAATKHVARTPRHRRRSRQQHRPRLDPPRTRLVGEVPKRESARCRCRLHRPQPAPRQVRLARTRRRPHSLPRIRTRRPHHRRLHRSRRRPKQLRVVARSDTANGLRKREIRTFRLV